MIHYCLISHYYLIWLSNVDYTKLGYYISSISYSIKFKYFNKVLLNKTCPNLSVKNAFVYMGEV